MKWKRPIAIAGLLLIAACYLCTLIFALLDSPNAPNMLMASLFCTIVVPVALYGYQMIYQISRRKLDDDQK